MVSYMVESFKELFMTTALTLDMGFKVDSTTHKRAKRALVISTGFCPQKGILM